MRVLGVDCGTEYTGYGIVELCPDNHLICLISGAIKLSPREPLARRLATVFERLGAIIPNISRMRSPSKRSSTR